MNSVSGKGQQVKGREVLMQALSKAHTELVKAVVAEVSTWLVQVVTLSLHRLFHERRESLAGWIEDNGRCQRCQSCAVRDFMRNGYRPRTLLTPLGWIEFFLPRLRCRCGGSVAVDFAGFVRPMTARVVELLRHAEDRQAMGRAEQASKQFNVNRTIEAYLAWYEEILAQVA